MQQLCAPLEEEIGWTGRRCNGVYCLFADAACREREIREDLQERAIREAEQLMEQSHGSSQESGLFSEPDDDSGFSHLVLNLNGNDEPAKHRYRKIEMVVDSVAFVSGIPLGCLKLTKGMEKAGNLLQVKHYRFKVSNA